VHPGLPCQLNWQSSFIPERRFNYSAIVGSVRSSQNSP
jgi:hypothetical protein